MYSKVPGITRRISSSLLKEVVIRAIIIPKGVNGGSRKGVPKVYLNDVINDMVYFGLLRRVDTMSFEVLENKGAFSRLKKKFPF